MLFMTLYAYRIISVHKTLNFMHFLQKCDIPTDGRTDRLTGGRTDGQTHPLIEMLGASKKAHVNHVNSSGSVKLQNLTFGSEDGVIEFGQNKNPI